MSNILQRVRYKALEVLGLAVINKRKFDKRKNYEIILPYASLAPWKGNVAFKKEYEIIKSNTLVDKYRCYELWQMIEETAGLSGAYIEVGVWRGGTGCLIAKKVQLSGIKENVYLCDTFSGVVKAGNKDTDYTGGEHADTAIEIVEKLMKDLEINNVSILKGVFPDETGHLVKDNQIRFCHIDVDVYQSAKDIFNWTWPKLVTGGVIVFDDYGFDTCEGVALFVDEERNKKDRIVIHNLNGHAVIIKLSQQG